MPRATARRMFRSGRCGALNASASRSKTTVRAVSAERLAQVETALERFETRGEIASALGLGLTLAASVARAHKGCISIAHRPDDPSGLTVRLEWPMEPEKPE